MKKYGNYIFLGAVLIFEAYTFTKTQDAELFFFIWTFISVALLINTFFNIFGLTRKMNYTASRVNEAIENIYVEKPKSVWTEDSKKLLMRRLGYIGLCAINIVGYIITIS